MAIYRVRAKPATIDVNGQGVLEFDFTPYIKPEKPGIVTRMIAGLLFAGTNALEDHFERVVAAGNWGTPNLGPAWIPLETAGAYEVDGSHGRIRVPGPATRSSISSPINLANVEIFFRMDFWQTTFAAGDQVRALLRIQDLNNYYIGALERSAAGANVDILRRSGGVETQLATTAKNSLIVGAIPRPVNFRFSIFGDSLALRIWLIGDSEPSVPDTIATDGTITAAGGVGTGSTSVDDVILLDDLVAASGTATSLAIPTWDAYINDFNDPTNLQDSSQGVPLPRWVPALVNGQPVFINDRLYLVASGGSENAQIFGSCHLVVED